MKENKNKSNSYDVIIVGGGPAGLNAALILGRCRRKVIVFDSGKYRNQYSSQINGYLTRDGISPKEFIKLSRKEISKYQIEIKEEEIKNGSKKDNWFELIDKHGNIYYSKKLLLATGLQDKIPDIKGFIDCYGISIFHCPYCDGYEVKDKAIGIYSQNKTGFDLALNIYNWSTNIILFTDGSDYINDKMKRILQEHKIKVYKQKIEQITHKNGQVKYIELNDGTKLERQAVFFSHGYNQRSILGEQLGCNYTKTGIIVNDKMQHTNIPGLFVAGDASLDMKFIVVAASEGAKAAVVINKEFIKERIREMKKKNKQEV
ncbi:MAG: NAD(P)/FAD-dependent oxidoreductase [Bacteroidota bacterium]|nr:NAD(P)/FAD-dependent oxidoreductase [Bacteroidota bacterium]